MDCMITGTKMDIFLFASVTLLFIYVVIQKLVQVTISRES